MAYGYQDDTLLGDPFGGASNSPYWQCNKVPRSALTVARITGSEHAYDVLRGGIWQARVTLDPVAGVLVRAGGLTAGDGIAVLDLLTRKPQ